MARSMDVDTKQQVNSLDNLDLSAIRSFNDSISLFQPEELSDVTVHYCDHSYRMHSYVLAMMSGWFKVLLISHESTLCSVTSRCSKPGHRCIVIEGDCIGGVDVSAEVLAGFFRHMYQIQDGTGQHKRPGEPTNEVEAMPVHYYLRMPRKIDELKTCAHCDFYEYDGVFRRRISYESTPTPAAVGILSYSTSTAEHPHYHLADYFQCLTLMSRYEKQAELTVETDTKSGGYILSTWRILVLTDRYHWPKARQMCIEACNKDNYCKSRPEWEELVSRLKFATWVDIFIAK